MTLGRVVDGEKTTNFDGKFILVNFTVVNAEHRVTHGLSRVPNGGIQVTDFLKGNAFGIRIESTQDATDKLLFLKSAEAKPALLFIW